mgnify:CR=1 FL=1
MTYSNPFSRPILYRFTLVLLLGTHTLWADGSRPPEEIESLLPPYVGAAVMAIDDGKLIFQHAWGKLCLDSADICTATTNFRIASVSKQFTATAILLLVDRGSISLDDTLNRFFPESPDYWRRITVHQLLTHTSGLPDYEKLIPEGTTLQLTDLNVLELLRATKEPLFDPGEKFAYSNSGYTLLGLIVESMAHRPFQQFMRTEIFAPLGMDRSVLYVAGMNRISERAYGHELDSDNQWIVADQSVTSAVRGDGGIYSSLEDLQKWIASLDQHSLLSESSYLKMFTPQVRSDRGQQDYGYGWFLDTYHGERRAMHAGSTRGFSLMLQGFPDRRAAVVILLNRSALDPPGDYVEKIVDCLLFQQGE